jgi:hypothetical protein
MSETRRGTAMSHEVTWHEDLCKDPALTERMINDTEEGQIIQLSDGSIARITSKRVEPSPEPHWVITIEI